MDGVIHGDDLVEVVRLRTFTTSWQYQNLLNSKMRSFAVENCTQASEEWPGPRWRSRSISVLYDGRVGSKHDLDAGAVAKTAKSLNERHASTLVNFLRTAETMPQLEF
jgi:hypothetical protein